MSCRLAFALCILVACAGAGPLAWSGPRQVGMADFVQDVWDAGEGGLPHPGVTSIRQTRDGYIWVTTFAGAVRFDGIQFEAPTVPDPRAQVALGDHVRCQAEASDGTLWFGTRRAGAIQLKGGVARIFSTKDGLASNDVRAVAVTGDGTTWFATAEGLSARDPSGAFRTFRPEQGLPARNTVALLCDKDGTLWVGTTDFGVARLEGTRFQSVPLTLPENMGTLDQAFGVPMRSVGALARDPDGVLWAGTSAGLTSVPVPGTSGGPAKAHLAFSGAVNGLWPSRKGGLWASTGGGLGRLEGGEWTMYTSREGLVNDGLMAVFEDAEGSVWLGTRIGLARLRPRVIRTYTQRDGVGHDAITTVLETRKGEIWAGHRNGVSHSSEGAWVTLGVEDGLPNPSVRALAEGPDGAMWIGTLDGLARYRDGRMRVYRSAAAAGNYGVRCLVFDAQGSLWIAANGIDRLKGDRVETVVPRASLCDQSVVNAFHIARDGTMWMGTAAALVRIEGGRSECFKDTEVPSRNDVRTIHEDKDGVVWVGSIGGLARMRGGVLEHIAGGGALGTSVYGMIEDDLVALWCSTPLGLYRIEKADLDHARDLRGSVQRLFGTAEGMDTPVGTGGGQPNTFRGRDGRLWFTTATGVSVVDPGRIELDSALPRIDIQQIVADRKAVDLSGPRRLAAGTRDVELHFALLSFIAPERARYKYMLDGHDSGWVESGNRRVAYYSNLAPGHYVFRVLAANHNGIWSGTAQTIDFSVAPHFYQRRWFAPLVVLFLLVAATAAYRIRIARHKAREEELKRRVDEEVAKVQVLSGLLPICASCRRVREDTGYWRQIEAYVQEHSSAKFSHGVCPECWEKMREEEPGLPAYGDTRKP